MSFSAGLCLQRGCSQAQSDPHPTHATINKTALRRWKISWTDSDSRNICAEVIWKSVAHTWNTEVLCTRNQQRKFAQLYSPIKINA